MHRATQLMLTLACSLLFLLALAPVQAQPEDASLVVRAHDEGAPDSRAKRPFWFTADGLEGRNPTLALEPGQEVVVRFINEGSGVHTFHVDAPIEMDPTVVEPNGTATVRVHVPEDATDWTTYVCELHDVVGMGGFVSFGGTPPRDVPELAMDRGDLIPFEPHILVEWATVAGQLAPAVLAVGVALWTARRPNP